MYKVFFNDRKIVITGSRNAPILKDEMIIENLNSVKDVKHLIQKAFIKWDFQLTIGLRNSLFILYFESNFETLKIIG